MKKLLVEWIKMKALSSNPSTTHTHTHTHTQKDIEKGNYFPFELCKSEKVTGQYVTICWLGHLILSRQL
jgi:hypothetical protein